MIDLFKGFHREAIQQEYPPSARVLFDTLVYKLNEAYWPVELGLSERELSEMTCLAKTTLHEAKRCLASRHIIECKPFKKKTAYRLGAKYQELLERSSERPVTDQSPTSERPVAGGSVLPARKDVKTSDASSSSGRAQARACEERKPAAADCFDELDALLEHWQFDLRGGRLSIEHQSEIKRLADTHGFEWVKAVMDEASESNAYGLSMKLLRKVAAGKLKGDSKDVKPRKTNASGWKFKPADSTLPEWAAD